MWSAVRGFAIYIMYKACALLPDQFSSYLVEDVLPVGAAVYVGCGMARLSGEFLQLTQGVQDGRLDIRIAVAMGTQQMTEHLSLDGLSVGSDLLS